MGRSTHTVNQKQQVGFFGIVKLFFKKKVMFFVSFVYRRFAKRTVFPANL